MACCSCNCSPCSCSPSPTTCCTPTTESVEYTFENQNAVGIGVFDNETDNLVGFRGLVSNSASLTLTLNATDNTIEIDFDDAALIVDIPDASPTQRGILDTATDAEAIAKALTNKILVPSNLAALDASTSFQGLVELATEAETIAGVSTTLAVTPAGLAAVGATNTTTTWADAVTRAGADPSFAGQLGTQLDTDVPYLSRSAAVGGFDTPILVGRGTNTLAAATFIATDGFQLAVTGAGSFVVQTATTIQGDAVLSGSSTTIGNGSAEFLNFNGTVFQLGGVAMADSMLGADAGGNTVEYAIDAFISSYNPQTGYTNFANPAVLRTCDTATVTLPQLAQIVGTLINDLKARQLPAT